LVIRTADHSEYLERKLHKPALCPSPGIGIALPGQECMGWNRRYNQCKSDQQDEERDDHPHGHSDSGSNNFRTLCGRR
jgi:hypothetical protein